MESIYSQIREILQGMPDWINLSEGQGEEKGSKRQIRPVKNKRGVVFQESLFKGAKVYHSNLSLEEMAAHISRLLEEARYRQMQYQGSWGRGSWRIQSGGKIQKKESRVSEAGEELGQDEGAESRFAHDRQKSSLLPRDQPLPFLLALDVQKPGGGIKKEKYHKFRQINRYLEMVEEILPPLLAGREAGQPLRILDFGCGKSYLTFALYYYLVKVRGLEVSITGLDLKEDVISRCQTLAREWGYEGLEFCHGDISRWQEEGELDMVVSLHACDTATDHALYKAILWRAKAILAVPCCQHELNGQLQSALWRPIWKYGLLKERMAALVTDGLRAALLEMEGYQVQMLEFVEMEHTPKNILIRGLRRPSPLAGSEREKRAEAINQLMEAVEARPTLAALLGL